MRINKGGENYPCKKFLKQFKIWKIEISNNSKHPWVSNIVVLKNKSKKYVSNGRYVALNKRNNIFNIILILII